MDVLQQKMMVQRLKNEMNRSEINARELAERADVGRSFVYDILSGKSNNPTTYKLAAIAKVLGVNVQYLLHGERYSSPIEASSADDLLQQVVTIPSVAVEASAGGGTLVSEELEEEPYFFRRNWIRNSLHANPADLRVIHVRGDSMHPTLQDGDTVLTDISKKTPTPPGIFVLFDGIGLVVKRLEYVSKNQEPSVRILSDNPQYDPYERSAMDVNIIGRVVWFAREV